MPGVTIHSVDGGRDVNNRILFMQRLIIDAPMYDILRRGEHRFSCGVKTVGGSRGEDTFVVRKRG